VFLLPQAACFEGSLMMRIWRQWWVVCGYLVGLRMFLRVLASATKTALEQCSEGRLVVETGFEGRLGARESVRPLLQAFRASRPRMLRSDVVGAAMRARRFSSA
jgi:hypothetical protein